MSRALKRIFVHGFPSLYGGAGTELHHQILGGETRDTLTLDWKRWDPMELEWKEKNFQGPSVTLARLDGSRSLWELPPPDEGALESFC